MIDWISLLLPLRHIPLPAGVISSINIAGEEEWRGVKAGRVEGSYSSSGMFKSQGAAGDGLAEYLYISGNPSKFLQGHNVFGSEELIPLVAEFVRQILQKLELPELGYAEALRGNYEVLRVDIARSFCAGSPVRAQAVQAALALKSRTRRGRCQTIGGTNYWNLTRRKTRWILKSYWKYEEITAGKKHRLPDLLPGRDLILEFAHSLVRIEVEIYKQELKELGFTHGRHFTAEIVDRLYKTFWERVEMATQAQIASDELMSLSRTLRSTYLTWQHGADVRNGMAKPTFYRHRTELLHYGVDIAIPNDCESGGNVIPFFTVIEAKPVSTPDWAFPLGLCFSPKPRGI